jgi:serine/threonine protein kinase
MNEPSALPPTQADSTPASGAADFEMSLTEGASHNSHEALPLHPLLPTVTAEPHEICTDGEVPTSPQRGQFTLLHRHASGGVGDVHVARDEKLKRQVALKEIRADRRSSPTVRQRFINEAEITGLLEHPGIVPIYALDQDETGSPYYAMRFIQGQTFGQAIQSYHHQPSVLRFRELLQRFVTVCQTMAYAHSKEVIHRDLKPSNIMLGEFGETLVLDWGLAKQMQQSDCCWPSDPTTPVSPTASDNHPFTQVGQVIGTLAYMSPEQAEGKLGELGPATDIFALGAILYELLTGRHPYAEIPLVTMIYHVRLGRFPAPRQIKREIPRALEAICLKAMASVPTSRYGTATELAQDVERWLGGEPVTAFAEPWMMRSYRWLRRHRSWVISGAVLLIMAVVALSVGTVLLSQANQETKRERNAALKAKEEAEAARQRAENAEQAAHRAAAEATAVTNFLVKDMIQLASPLTGGRNLTVKQAMDAAAARITDVFGKQPALEAGVRDAVGRSYFYLGCLTEARPHLERALILREQTLGPDHSTTITLEFELAHCLLQNGHYPEAEQHFRRLWTKLRRSRGEDYPQTLEAMSLLGAVQIYLRHLDEGEALVQRAYAAFQKITPPGTPLTGSRLIATVNLSVALADRGRWPEAEKLCREVLTAYLQTDGPQNAQTCMAKLNLAAVLTNQGKNQEAEILLREALPYLDAVYGEDNLKTLMIRINLSAILITQGRWEEAEPLTRTVVDHARRTQPRDHPIFQKAVLNRAAVLTRLGRWKEAVELMKELPGKGTKPAARPPASSPP